MICGATSDSANMPNATATDATLVASTGRVTVVRRSTVGEDTRSSHQRRGCYADTCSNDAAGERHRRAGYSDLDRR